jgi:hypothetical protein
VLLAAAALFVWPEILRDHQAYRVQLLGSAGDIETGPISSSIPVDSVAGPATGTGNAAWFYVQALNSWNARRQPWLLNRKLNPFADEPMPNPAEIHLMRAGAAQRNCDFYVRAGDRTAFTFITYPRAKPWPFEPASDPYAMRPYINIMRLVAQGVLNAGKKLERAGNQAEAERDYQTVVRFGDHLRQHPGSILDVQLSLELEQKGLHYIDVHYGLTKQALKQRALWKYGDSLKRVASAIERKYTQLGNPEAAMVILQRDSEIWWRVQAATALRIALDTDRYGWLEQRDIRSALAAARQDSDRTVRLAARVLETRPVTPKAIEPPRDEAVH